jgi:mRNA interferase MazF
MPNANRGEVWLIDFGMAAKIRPALILGCDFDGTDRAIVTVVYHTTSLRGSQFEVPMRVSGLDAGGFDAQAIYTVPASKLIRRKATLARDQLALVEARVKAWLGFR